MTAPLHPQGEREQLTCHLVAEWWSSAFPADRLRCFTLWTNGNLYMTDRASVHAVWSPPHQVGERMNLGDSRRTARLGHCRHERLAPPSPPVTAYLAEHGDGPQGSPRADRNRYLRAAAASLGDAPIGGND